MAKWNVQIKSVTIYQTWVEAEKVVEAAGVALDQCYEDMDTVSTKAEVIYLFREEESKT